MSKYTMTIQEFCRSVKMAAVLENDPSADALIEVENMTEEDYYFAVQQFIFPTDWPFYNDSFEDRQQFIRDFTDYFMFYEIGQSSIGQFRHNLKRWLRLEMHYFRQLYESQIGSVGDLLKNVDVWRTIKGTTNEKTGTIDRDGGTTYGRHEARQDSSGQNQTNTYGRTDTNTIIPLGGSSFTPLSKQNEGGTDSANNQASSSGSVDYSGRDSTDHKETYNTKDQQDLTEHRAGNEGVNMAEAVKKYRELILDINSTILNRMRREGLFLQIW